LTEQRASVSDIGVGFAALDRAENRLQKRVWIFGRTCVAPHTDKVGRGAQFKQTGFLASRDFDRLEEAGFSARPIRLSALERDLAVKTI